MAGGKAACATTRQLCNIFYCRQGTGIRVSGIFRHPFISTKIYSISQWRLCSTQTIIESGEDISNNVDKPKKEKNPIWYYRNKGIRKRKINQLVRKAVELKDEKFPKGEKYVVQMAHMIRMFEKCDITEVDVRHILFHKPNIFRHKHKDVYKSLMELQDKGYSNHIVRKMVLASPGLLLKKTDEQTVEKRFHKLQELDIEPKLTAEKCLYLGQKCPELLTISDTDKLNAKIKNLKALRFNESLLHELIMKYPKVLLMSEKAVREKVSYVCNEMKGRPAIFTNFPRIFSSSLRRIKDRWSYLLSEGFARDTTRASERKMRAIVLTTDKDFVYRVCETKLKDYRKFQKKLLRDEAIAAESATIPVRDKLITEATDDVIEIKDGDDDDYEDDDEDEEEEEEEEEEVGESEDDYQNRYKLDSFHDDDLYKDGYTEAFEKRTKHTVDEDNEWYNRPFGDDDDDDDDDDDGTQRRVTSQRRVAKGYKPKGFINYNVVENEQDDDDDDFSNPSSSSSSKLLKGKKEGRRGRKKT